MNILTFSFSQVGMVVGSSLAPYLHLNRIIDLLFVLPLCLREGDHLFVKLMFGFNA